MRSTLEARQTQIDALIEETPVDETLILRRLLNLAKAGMKDPSVLSFRETQQICGALVAHYRHMDIPEPE